MKVTILGDFADPLSYLASQRVDRIARLGLFTVHWLAVESDRSRPMSGLMVDETVTRAVRQLSMPGEALPPSGLKVPNSRAATAAYAESVSDGIDGAIRRALFDAVWIDRRRVDDPDVIRSIVSAVLSPEPLNEIDARIRANQPIVRLGDPDVLAISRRLGFIVSMGRGPLTLVGQQRIDAWRQIWRRHNAPPLPLVMTDLDQTVSGEHALRWLASHLIQQPASDPLMPPASAAHGLNVPTAAGTR